MFSKKVLKKVPGLVSAQPPKSSNIDVLCKLRRDGGLQVAKTRSSSSPSKRARLDDDADESVWETLPDRPSESADDDMVEADDDDDVPVGDVLGHSEDAKDGNPGVEQPAATTESANPDGANAKVRSVLYSL